MVPQKWDEAGFDAAHIVPELKKIEFYKLIEGCQCNWDHFSKFLSKLNGSEFKFELFFVKTMESSKLKIIPRQDWPMINHKEGLLLKLQMLL